MKRLLLSRTFLLQIAVSLLLVLLLFMNKSHGSSMKFAKYSFSITSKVGALPPAIPPSSRQPQPFIPLLAPSPLIPFTNNSVPKLSGLFINTLVLPLLFTSILLPKRLL